MFLETLTRVYDAVYLLRYSYHHHFHLSFTKQVKSSVSQKLYFDQSVLYFQLSVWIFIAITLHHSHLHYPFSSFSSFFCLRFLYLLHNSLVTGTHKPTHKSIDFFFLIKYILMSIPSSLEWR